MKFNASQNISSAVAERKNIAEKQSQLTNYAVILASFVVILAGVHSARAILSPIFMATFFAVLLLPATHWLQSKGWAQATSMTVVILSVLFVGILTTTILGSQLSLFVQNIPVYKKKFNEELTRFNLSLGDFFPSLEDQNNPSPENESTKFSPQRQNQPFFSKEISRQEQKTSLIPFFPPTSSAPLPMKSPLVAISSLSSISPNSIPPVAPLSDSGDFFYSPNSSVALARYLETSEPVVSLATIASGVAASGRSVNEAKTDGATLNGFDPNDDSASKNSNGFFELSSNERSDGFFGATNSRSNDSADPKNDASESPDVAASDDLDSSFDPDGSSFRRDEARDDSTQIWSSTPENAVNAGSRELFSFLKNLASELSFLASNAFIIMLLVIFMLLEGSKLPLKITAALGKRNLTNEHIRRVADDIRRYMFIKTFVSIIVGLLVTILLIVSNVQYPLLWGFIAFFLNYIPNIGSVVAAIPPIILATVDHGFWIGGIDAIFFVLINCFVGYVIEPKLLGDGLDLSPLVVLLSLIISGWILGPVGMFLSPPLAVIIKIILQSFPETRWIAVIMANRVQREKEDDPPVPAAE